MSLYDTPLKNCITKTLSRHMQVPTPKETSLCTFHKGSFTIEAAIVIPLIAGALVSVLFFLRMIQVQAAVDEALIYAGRKVAAESSITDSTLALFLSAETFFLEALEEYECIDQYVENGKLGIYLLKSDFSEDEIYLRAEYHMKSPVSFFGIGNIYIWQQNRFRKWTGVENTKEQQYVYITANGEVYHASSDCRSIKLKIKQTTKERVEEFRGMDGQKYYSCEVCKKASAGYVPVYYTDYGKYYHFDISCSALKRTITKIPLSEVEERKKCSYCYSGL